MNTNTRRTKIIVIATVIVALALAALVWGMPNNADLEQEGEAELGGASVEVELFNVSDGENLTFSLSGRVESVDQAVITTQGSGRVERVPFSVGDTVRAGDVLVQLEQDDVRAQLSQAEASLDSQRARLEEMLSGSRQGEIEIQESAVESARSQLENVKRQTEREVRNAYQALLNNDLRAYLVDEGVFVGDRYNLDPPQISGTYEGDREGEYTIDLYRSGAQSGYSFRYTAPDGSRGIGSVNTRVPQPLGNKGLYIRFPEEFARKFDLEWVVPVPNTRGSGYLAARERYETATEERENTVRQAEETLRQRERELELTRSGTRSEQIEAQRAQVRQAEANVESVRSQLSKQSVRAPFAGTISQVSTRAGESLSSGREVVMLVNEGQLRVIAFVSPAQARSLEQGDRVLVDERYEGRISAVSRALSEGTGQVEVQIVIDDPDTDLIVGEYVEAEVFAAAHNEGLIPLSALSVTSAGNAVYTVEDGVVSRIEVEIGPLEGDFVRITEGLEGVDSIVRDASRVRPGLNVKVVN